MTSKKRKVREILSSDKNPDAETIQYAEPYKDTSKKDEIFRRKTKKKAIKILTNKRRKVNTDDEQDNFSDGETPLLKKTKYIGKKQRKEQ